MKQTFTQLYQKLMGAFHLELKQAIHPYTQVLDVGCGDNSPLQHFSSELDSTGIDGFAPSIEKSRERKIHSRYIESNLTQIEKLLSPNSYDCVVCLDVIEHFEKQASGIFIKQLESLARKRVILFTPNGFLPQGALGGNEFQIHRCGWEVEELESLGYSVIGIYGYKPLRGEYACFTIRPYLLGKLISDISQPWVRNKPQLAFALLAVKEL